MSDSSPNPLAERPNVPSADTSGVVPTSPTVPTHPAFPVAQAPVAAAVSSSGTRGMYTAAAILNWVTLAIVIAVTFGIGAIAAAWVVPMTILTHKAAKGPYKHTALGVCTLLFVNIISGILMLVDDSNRPAKPVR